MVDYCKSEDLLTAKAPRGKKRMRDNDADEFFVEAADVNLVISRP